MKHQAEADGARSRSEQVAHEQQTRTRAHEITGRIRAALIDGELGDGRINEVHLANTLAVSRTPVRAALQTLAGEGLLDHAPNRGFAVRAFDLVEIGDAFEIRALSEGLACRMAAERGLTSVQSGLIAQALKQGDELLAGSASLVAKRSGYSNVNALFHDTLREAARSRPVLDVLRLCSRIPHIMAHHVVAFDIEDVQRRHAEHHEIFRAVCLREPRHAEQLMREHILHVKHSFVSNALAEKRVDPGSSPATRAEVLDPKSQGLDLPQGASS